jgi:hypothetical protein
MRYIMDIQHYSFNLIHRKCGALLVKDAEQKSMHSTMIELWVTSIEYAIITWRAGGFLRATPEAIQNWYTKGEVTAEIGHYIHQGVVIGYYIERSTIF